MLRLGAPKILEFVPRSTSVSVPGLMIIHPVAVETFHKTTIEVLGERSGESQDSSSENHDCAKLNGNQSKSC